MENDVPEWAVGRALEELGVRGQPVCHVVKGFARYIAAHEPAPVDCLRNIVGDVEKAVRKHDDGDGIPTAIYLDLFAAELRARGVTVPDEGEPV